MLVFHLTPDSCAADGHTSLSENGGIRIELKLDEALTKAVTILLYQEFDASVQIDRLRNVTNFRGIDTFDIYRAINDEPTFAGVFMSDLLPAHPLPGLVRYTLIIRKEVHTEHGIHWVAVHFYTRSTDGY